MSIYNLSICLSDIPKEGFRVSEKNGKTYLNISAAPRKEPDYFGNDVSVWVTQSKEQREAKEDRNYCGSGKKYDFGGKAPENHSFPQQTQNIDPVTGQQNSNYNPSPENVDDLPF